jgi:hypothetical protein
MTARGAHMTAPRQGTVKKNHHRQSAGARLSHPSTWGHAAGQLSLHYADAAEETAYPFAMQNTEVPRAKGDAIGYSVE